MRFILEMICEQSPSETTMFVQSSLFNTVSKKYQGYLCGITTRETEWGVSIEIRLECRCVQKNFLI